MGSSRYCQPISSCSHSNVSSPWSHWFLYPSVQIVIQNPHLCLFKTAVTKMCTKCSRSKQIHQCLHRTSGSSASRRLHRPCDKPILTTYGHQHLVKPFIQFGYFEHLLKYQATVGFASSFGASPPASEFRLGWAAPGCNSTGPCKTWMHRHKQMHKLNKQPISPVPQAFPCLKALARPFLLNWTV